ncbi:MAG: MarC family protein [Candidatus Micrarchaeota archaeon]
MADFLAALIPAFIYIFIIVDPLASIPIFISMTKEHTASEMRVAATKAVLIAGAIALLFLLAGPQLLDLMHITLKDFKVAGGIVLMLLGLEAVLGFTLQKDDGKKKDNLGTVAVLIATPLLTGPGLLTALVILSEEQGMLIAVSAIVAALFVSWLMLFNAVSIRRILGEQMIEIGSKVIGLLILALGVSYMKSGLI